jgi:hypothetical protein
VLTGERLSWRGNRSALPPEHGDGSGNQGEDDTAGPECGSDRGDRSDRGNAARLLGVVGEGLGQGLGSGRDRIVPRRDAEALDQLARLHGSEPILGVGVLPLIWIVLDSYREVGHARLPAAPATRRPLGCRMRAASLAIALPSAGHTIAPAGTLPL